MPFDISIDAYQDLQAFIALCGAPAWQARQTELARRLTGDGWASRAGRQRHALELALGRLGRTAAIPTLPPTRAGEEVKTGMGAGASLAAPANSPAEQQLLLLAQEAVRLSARLSPGARCRLRQQIRAAMEGDQTLVPLFHLLRSAALYRERGFTVSFPRLEGEDQEPDLLIERDGMAAEVLCETVSAEGGRPLYRAAWSQLMDRLNPALHRWLAQHPGRYILKMTLPEGLREDAAIASLQAEIEAMLGGGSRQAESGLAMLKLDPLTMPVQAKAGVLLSQLRAQFGPESHLAILQPAPAGASRPAQRPPSSTAALHSSVFVLAARAGQENGIAAAVTRHMAQATPRLSGRRPGILAVFVEDLDHLEWRRIRERLELEGATRRFLTEPVARPVIAVSCASRAEMYGMAEPHAVAEGELRFRNQAHPEARSLALAPAILSSV